VVGLARKILDGNQSPEEIVASFVTFEEEPWTAQNPSAFERFMIHKAIGSNSSAALRLGSQREDELNENANKS